MKITLLILTVVLSLSLNGQFNRNQNNYGLKSDSPKLVFGMDFNPWSPSIHCLNVFKKFGIYHTANYAFYGVPNSTDKSIPNDYVLTDEKFMRSRFLFEWGATYRIWKIFHATAGFGMGAYAKELTYSSGNDYITQIEKTGIKGLVSAGLVMTFWRLSFGYKYSTYTNDFVFNIGYVMKVPKGKN